MTHLKNTYKQNSEKMLIVLLFFPTGLTLTVLHSNKRKDFLESEGVLNG